MRRFIALLLALPLSVAIAATPAQTKKPGPAPKAPSAKESAVSVNVYMRDANKDELLLSTRIWPDYPEYNALALQRFFAVMKALEPTYKQDDEVAYTWGTKAKVTKCTIYLESSEAGAKNGTGSVVGCEANGVSSLAVPSVADPKIDVSPSSDPRHLNDVMELFKKQSERARATVSRQ